MKALSQRTILRVIGAKMAASGFPQRMCLSCQIQERFFYDFTLTLLQKRKSQI